MRGKKFLSPLASKMGLGCSGGDRREVEERLKIGRREVEVIEVTL